MWRKMALFICSCLVSLTKSVLLLFRFLAWDVLRTSPLREDSESTESNVKKAMEKEGMEESVESMISSFSFKFQCEISNNKETPVTLMEENESFYNIHNYHFWSEVDINRFVEEPKAFKDNNFDGDKHMMQLKKQNFEEEKFSSACSETSSVAEREDGLILEEFSGFDSDTESSSDGYSVRELIIDSDCGSSFLISYFGDCENDSEIRQTSWNNSNELSEGQLELFFLERSEGREENDEDSQQRSTFLMLGKFYDSLGQTPFVLHVKFEEESLNEKLSFAKIVSACLEESGEAESEHKIGTLDTDGVGKTVEFSSDTALNNSVYVSYAEREKSEVEKEKSKEACTLNFGEYEFDEIWEHQDLIEQLKLELRKVRAISLPTILEESESPRAVEERKPFKIDEKLSPKDPMDDLHKLYECYMERMWKFDILNYQKMYATCFLQLKDPLELKKTQRCMLSTIMSHLSQRFLPFGKKKSNCDPSEKYIKELRCDLETVYVGQICLSWEFLRWQYEKFHELSDSLSFISHQYNNVAAEFQQMKLTLQRFVENEAFQGSRLANYVKQRCLLRNFLQLPLVKDDCLKDKMEKRKEEDVITRERLWDNMEETMTIFWEFVKAEKYEARRFFKGLVENNLELQDPSDYEFMIDIRTRLQKKEKKLKDILKAGNCIVKKFKRRQEGSSSQDLFFSQVDLKLVSRVLRMSRITSDQLIWCEKKMSKITFSGRKVHREPSFLLFPCYINKA